MKQGTGVSASLMAILSSVATISCCLPLGFAAALAKAPPKWHVSPAKAALLGPGLLGGLSGPASLGTVGSVFFFFLKAGAFVFGSGLAIVPLFTFAAYLGTVAAAPPHGALGAAIALVAIFLPGLLLLVGVLPFWHQLRANPTSRALSAGVNASVVGVLLAALCQPVWTSTVLRPTDFLFVVAGFVALVVWKTPPWIVVIAAAALGAASNFLG